MPTSSRARSPRHRKAETAPLDSTVTESAAYFLSAPGHVAATEHLPTPELAGYDSTEPTAADLDLSGYPELLAIPDPADLAAEPSLGEPSLGDLSDPDTVGELDPNQTIELPDGADEAPGDNSDSRTADPS